MISHHGDSRLSCFVMQPAALNAGIRSMTTDAPWAQNQREALSPKVLPGLRKRLVTQCRSVGTTWMKHFRCGSGQ